MELYQWAAPGLHPWHGGKGGECMGTPSGKVNVCVVRFGCVVIHPIKAQHLTCRAACLRKKLLEQECKTEAFDGDEF